MKRSALLALPLLFLAACEDSPTTTPPAPVQSVINGSPRALSATFDRITPEVMALPRTVFAARDEAAGQLVFGVEVPEVAAAVDNVMEQLGVPASDYRVEVTEPIRFLNQTLRTQHRPTKAGIQIHFGNYLCTLGFNAQHDAVPSFFTNSHCTDRQGETDGTIYYQPTSNENSTPIGTEVHDPPYLKGEPAGVCSFNKKCRWSDAARVEYASNVGSTAEIAKTDALNTGSLNVGGFFDVTVQDLTSENFSGDLDKVGRTTGWTRGTVEQSCATVNVFGSNLQLLCQTLVTNESVDLVGSGDSGSPVFEQTGSGTAKLVGILWGGSGSTTFVFSPLSGLIKDGLGYFDATVDGTATPVETGTIAGTVTDAGDNSAISGAIVTVEGTSLSATTDASGGYTITNVPTGTYDVTASASGYVSQTATGVGVSADATTTVDFALQAASGPSGGTVRVEPVAWSTYGGRNNDRHLGATLTLVDGNGAPVSGASVSITLNRNSSFYESASGTTGTDGTVNFTFNNPPSGSYELIVVDVAASGYTWDEVPPTGNTFTKQ